MHHDPSREVLLGDEPVIAHDEFYGYTPAPFRHPGIGNLVLVPKFTKPVLNFYGTDILAGALKPTQPPQIYATSANPQAGIGGIQTGQLVHQPLYDMNESNDKTTSV